MIKLRSHVCTHKTHEIMHLLKMACEVWFMCSHKHCSEEQLCQWAQNIKIMSMTYYIILYDKCQILWWDWTNTKEGKNYEKSSDIFLSWKTNSSLNLENRCTHHSRNATPKGSGSGSAFPSQYGAYSISASLIWERKWAKLLNLTIHISYVCGLLHIHIVYYYFNKHLKTWFRLYLLWFYGQPNDPLLMIDYKNVWNTSVTYLNLPVVRSASSNHKGFCAENWETAAQQMSW